MKQYYLPRLWLLLSVLAVTLLLLASGVAYALVSVEKPLPAAVSVDFQSTPEGALGFYADSGCTVPVATLDFGQLKPGVTGMATVYIKNLTGGTAFEDFSVTDDMLKGSTSIYPTDLSPNDLQPGTSHAFDLFLELAPDVSPGAQEFTITVSAQTG